jgi:hypothetical protein
MKDWSFEEGRQAVPERVFALIGVAGAVFTAVPSLPDALADDGWRVLARRLIEARDDRVPAVVKQNLDLVPPLRPYVFGSKAHRESPLRR